MHAATHLAKRCNAHLDTHSGTRGIATRCNTLRHVATHCNTLRHCYRTLGHCYNTLRYCNTLRNKVTSYQTPQRSRALLPNKTLQHTATHSNTILQRLCRNTASSAVLPNETLQHSATRCNTLQQLWHNAASGGLLADRRNTTHCNTLQQTATQHYNTLQQLWHNTASRGLLPNRRNATHCNTPQRTATTMTQHSKPRPPSQQAQRWEFHPQSPLGGYTTAWPHPGFTQKNRGRKSQ